MKVNPETVVVDTATGKFTWEGMNAIQTIAYAAEGDTSETAGSGILDEWSGTISRVQNKTITLIQKTTFAGTISTIDTQSSAGTATFTFKVNGAALPGTANDVSTTEQTQSHSQSFEIGDKITLTMSDNSNCTDAAFSIHYQRL